MPHFKFIAEEIVEADSREDAEQVFAWKASCSFHTRAKCVELLASQTSSPNRVLVTVRGGVAEAFYDASEVFVEVLDYDEFKAKDQDPEPYLEYLVENWCYPDPRTAGFSRLLNSAKANDYPSRQSADLDNELYKLDVEDAQVVAQTVLGRCLTAEELEVVKDRLDDYMDIAEALTTCIQQRIVAETSSD